MAQVAFERVSKIYPDGTRAVNDINLEIKDGEFMVLVGPSGCGKTTALRMVAGLEEISEGVLKIGERIVNHVPSRDRDIAMVFQSYALYPHLSVYENIAFGLRLRKMSKQEIDERVQRAASVLGLEDYLKRKPRALSGGQRQRVAMGRAIVRQPAAFLMDEPLSNLDAKLRVQTRAEIAKLQSDLGVTTVYVTHDQIEAMTMGDRVAVMRKGELQQVDDPQTLYDRPVNLFVGGFIGSPAMNMLDATIENGTARLRARDRHTARRARERDARSSRPALRSYVGKQVIIGIRPEDLEDAALARERPPTASSPAGWSFARRSVRRSWRTSRSRPRTPRRTRCGSSPRTSARPTRRRRSASARTRRSSSAGSEPARGSRTEKQVEAVVDTRALHFFDPATGQRHLRLRERRLSEAEMGRHRRARRGAGSGRAAMRPELRRRRARQSADTAVSGTVTFDGIWTGSEAKAFGDVIKAFNKVYPKVQVNYNSLGNNLPTVLATAIAGGHPPDMADIAQPGYVKQLVQQGHLKPITYAKSAIASNFAPSWQQLGTVQREDVRASSSRRANKSLLWYNVPAFKAAGRDGAEDVGAADQGREHAQGLGHAGVLDRRRGRLDAHGPVREHLSPHVRASRSTTRSPRTRSSGPIRR